MSGSDEYVTTSSDYVSSVINENTPLFESRIEDSPFLSLTKSEKSKLNDILHKGKVSTYEYIEPDGYVVEPKVDETLSGKNSCCCLC